MRNKCNGWGILGCVIALLSLTLRYFEMFTRDTIFIILGIDFIKMEPWPIYHDQAGHVMLELQKWQIMCPLLLHKANKKRCSIEH